jgi:hypothetical protein
MNNPFAQYRTDGYHKPYKGIPIARLEEFKKFRRGVEAWTADSLGRTAKFPLRYVFRGPRGKNISGDTQVQRAQLRRLSSLTEPQSCKSLISHQL